MASPVAVLSPSSRPSTARRTASRSVVGATAIWAVPLKVTRPRLIDGAAGRQAVRRLLDRFEAGRGDVGGVHRQ